MNIFRRIINRLRFRRSIKGDESINVIDGMANARRLYRELAQKAHPDLNPDRREVAEELMQRIVANRRNYAQLLLLKREVDEKLVSPK